MDYDLFRKQARADYNNQPVNSYSGLTTYNDLDYNNEDHREALLESADKLEITTVCDEEAGGIIAYALGEENAVLIAQALLYYRKALERKEKRAGNK